MTEVTKEMVTDYLEQFISELSEEKTVELWNDYVEENEEMHKYIFFNNSEVHDKLFKTPSEALYMTNNSDYYLQDRYLTYSPAFGASSFNFLTDKNCPIDVGELVGYLMSQRAVYILVKSQLEK